MTTTDNGTLATRGLSTVSRLGQGTAIEQSRASSQVQMAMWAAQERPRDMMAVRAEMREECRQMHLAEQAFYSYRQAGQNITGPTVHLARELARIFGNFDFGFFELRRDDDFGQSEMMAFAWDLQRNVRNSTVVVSPHRRGGSDSKVLTDPQAINQNNANVGARRLREAIFAVLPRSFVDEAQELCRDTLDNGGGKPLAERVQQAVEAFVKLKVNVAQLEQRVGRRVGEWNGVDVGNLSILYRSISRGETTVAEQFAAAPVTAEEARSASKAAADAGPAGSAKTVALTDDAEVILFAPLPATASSDPDGQRTEPMAPGPSDEGAPAPDTERDVLVADISWAKPAGWDSARVAKEFEAGAGIPISEATNEQLRGFLAYLKSQTEAAES